MLSSSFDYARLLTLHVRSVFCDAHLHKQVQGQGLPRSRKVAAKEQDSMLAIEELTIDSPLTYQICIEGCLDRSWSDNVGDISMRVQSAPGEPVVTVITGEFQDQAALTGALMQLYGLGLPLLSVKIVGIDMAGL